jgi:hypothetical protein
MPTPSELARQVKEAEALVKRLETGQPAKVKDSAPVRTHGGYAGKSLIEMIRDDLRTTIADFEEEKLSKIANDDPYENDYLDGLIDGICHALGILRQNEGVTERQWAEAEYRESQRHEQKRQTTNAGETPAETGTVPT